MRSDQSNVLVLKAGETLQVSRKKNQIEIRTSKARYNLESVDICPSSDIDLLNYKKRTYRGIIRLKPSGSNIRLINIVDVEDYLKSVIFTEMGPASKAQDFEALKAFAVCLRNYTFMKVHESKADFDLYPDSRDQVYRGASSEKIFSNSAIDETNGLVLEYNGQLAKTFYYSSCGGHTENSDNVFSQKGIEYLNGVEDGNEDEPYCMISPSFNWTEKFTQEEIISLLKKAKYITNPQIRIKNIEVQSRFKSGRVNELKITTVNPEGQMSNLFLIGNSIRSIITSKETKGLLRSTLFDIEAEYKKGLLSSVQIKGRGNGHGVGFCQWGAIGQSRAGKKFHEILYSYFPGTKLSEI